MPLPQDHAVRLERAELALDGLSVGDAFGEQFFSPAIASLLAKRSLPRFPWPYTDDTEMATAIFDVLSQRGAIDQDLLAQAFAQRWSREPDRGYGGGAFRILRSILHGTPWRDASRAAFGGQGSFGNGGAMRVAPLGAYFADDEDALVEQARASAEVTHAHPDGQAGAIATALGAAYAWRWRNDRESLGGATLLEWVLVRTPPSETRTMLERARKIPRDDEVKVAMRALGTGAKVSAADTVPFALWCAARHLDAFEDAMWTTVSGLGDCDTTCAIAGGIVALSAGRASIPATWLVAREAPARALLRAG